MYIPLIVILSTSPLLEPATTAEAATEPVWSGIGPMLPAEPLEPERPVVQDAMDDMDEGRRRGVFVDEDAWYLRLSGGLSTTNVEDGPEEDVDFDDGIFAALAFGHHWGAEEDRVGFDVELEGVWTDQDTEGDIASFRDFNTVGVLLNGVVDFRLVDRLFLYGGAGLGTVWADVGVSETEAGDFDSDDGPYFTWQLKAGLQWIFSEAWSVNLGYRFMNINDIEIEDEDDFDTESFDLGTKQHVLELGVGLRF